MLVPLLIIIGGLEQQISSEYEFRNWNHESVIIHKSLNYRKVNGDGRELLIKLNFQLGMKINLTMRITTAKQRIACICLTVKDLRKDFGMIMFALQIQTMMKKEFTLCVNDFFNKVC